MDNQLTIVEVFYFVLSVAAVIFVGSIVYLVTKVRRTLDQLNVLIAHIDDTARDVNAAKDQMKRGLFKTVSSILGLFLRKRR